MNHVAEELASERPQKFLDCPPDFVRNKYRDVGVALGTGRRMRDVEIVAESDESALYDRMRPLSRKIIHTRRNIFCHAERNLELPSAHPGPASDFAGSVKNLPRNFPVCAVRRMFDPEFCHLAVSDEKGGGGEDKTSHLHLVALPTPPLRWMGDTFRLLGRSASRCFHQSFSFRYYRMELYKIKIL